MQATTSPAGERPRRADPAPEVLPSIRGVAYSRYERPEDPAAEQDQRRGKHDEPDGGGDHDADGAGRCRAARVVGDERQQEGQQADDQFVALASTASAVARTRPPWPSGRSSAR